MPLASRGCAPEGVSSGPRGAGGATAARTGREVRGLALALAYMPGVRTFVGMLKKLLITVAVLLVVVVVGFFVVTSSGFVKAVVLPRVAGAFNVDLAVEEVDLKPFSSVELRNVRVVPQGAEQLAAAELVRVRYRLFSILGGNMQIDEIFVNAPQVTVVQDAQGRSNLDPILRSMEDEDRAPGDRRDREPDRTADKTEFRLGSLRIQNGSFSLTTTDETGGRMLVALGGLAVTGSNLQSGGTGRVEFGADLRAEQSAATNAATAGGMISGPVTGAFDIALTEAGAPSLLSGRAEARLEQASGVFADFQGFSAVLTSDMTPTEVREAALAFSRNGQALGSVNARGPVNLETREASLQVNVTSIDRNVLNLLGAPAGLDFTTTRFDSTNLFTLSNGGQRFALEGLATGTQVSVRKDTMTMPPLELRKNYRLAADLENEILTIDRFALNAMQGGREIVRGNLSEPMRIAWGDQRDSIPDATIQLAVSDLRLADWSALAGTPLRGTVQGEATLGVRNGGRDLVVTGTAALAGLTGEFAGNVVSNLNARASAEAAIASFAEPANRTLRAHAVVEGLSGQVAALAFDSYAARADTEIKLPEDVLQIDRMEVQLTPGGQPGGRLDVRGRWNLEDGSGRLEFSARDVNEAGLRPMLQAALGDQQLRRARLTGSGRFEMGAQGRMDLEAEGQLSDLVVVNPSAAGARENPLSIGVNLKAAGRDNRLAIERGELRLTPTDRAENALRLTGNLDLSNTNALDGELKLAAQSLDVTPYFDMLFPPDAADADQPATPADDLPAPPQSEPETIELPVGTLRIEANVGRLHLRELVASNLVARTVITGSRIEVDPFQLSLNGAPVNAALNLNVGVPGYEYAIRASAAQVPMKPLVDSFTPVLRNRIQGAADAGMEIRGAGTTGVNLRRTLQGNMHFSVTNANLRLADAESSRGVLTLLTRVLASALNIRELREQPIMDMAATVNMGEGAIRITQAMARSASFVAATEGSIPIADDLMQSRIQLPVQLGLERELARRARLVSRDADTNVAYVALPEIASIEGTLGEPAPKVDTAKTALLVARGIGGLLGGEAGQAVSGVTDLLGNVGRGNTNAARDLVQGIGGLLNRGAGSTNTAGTNAPGTNAPATNAPGNPIGGLLRGILDRNKRE